MRPEAGRDPRVKGAEEDAGGADRLGSAGSREVGRSEVGADAGLDGGARDLIGVERDLIGVEVVVHERGDAASNISAHASRAPTRTRTGVRLISIGQIRWLNQSSIDTSSAAPQAFAAAPTFTGCTNIDDYVRWESDSGSRQQRCVVLLVGPAPSRPHPVRGRCGLSTAGRCWSAGVCLGSLTHLDRQATLPDPDRTGEEGWPRVRDAGGCGHARLLLLSPRGDTGRCCAPVLFGWRVFCRLGEGSPPGQP